MLKKIVETDNFGRDYPDESFLNLPAIDEDHAKIIVKAINNAFHDNYERHWKVVDLDYKLEPGFEP